MFKRQSRRSPRARGLLRGEPLEDRTLLAVDLVITEINYRPTDPTPAEAGWDDNDFEFLEVYNAEDVPINLGGLQFMSGVGFVFPDETMQPGEYAVIVRSIGGFQARYGTEPRILGQFTSGGVSDEGERLEIVDALGERVVDFEYSVEDMWPRLANGRGATLELINVNDSNSDLSKWYAWRNSTEWGGSPGEAGIGPLGIVVNEVLAHTDPPQFDSIELYNTTDQAIDISGWSLSDTMSTPNLYQIPAGTIVPAGGYVFFDERQFNPNPNNPGPNEFGLDAAEGDNVVLSVPDGSGGTTYFVDEVSFSASLNGVSFGRWPDGTGVLTPTTEVTLGDENASPQIGPVVISELSFNPGAPNAAALAIDPTIIDSNLEFVEIYNPTSQAVSLFEWDLGGGVQYAFAADASLAAGGAMVIVSFDPNDPFFPNRASAFRAHYGIDASVPLFGPYVGSLSNNGERIILFSIDEPPAEMPGFYPQVTHDFVIYDDDPPWPEDADGLGPSLQRIAPTSFGSFGVNWVSRPATPGTVPDIDLVEGDFSGNGRTDADDIELLNEAINDASQDLRFDLNGDSVVDGADRDAWVVAAGTHYGDANLDGLVDGRDLAIWRQWLGLENGNRWHEGDFDGNEVVDDADYQLWAANLFEIGSRYEPPPSTGRVPRAPLSTASVDAVLQSPDTVDTARPFARTRMEQVGGVGLTQTSSTADRELPSAPLVLDHGAASEGRVLRSQFHNRARRVAAPLAVELYAQLDADRAFSRQVSAESAVLDQVFAKLNVR